MKRIICENKYGDEIFSFDFKEDITFQNYNNCEIADIELVDDITIIRLQEIDADVNEDVL